MDSQVFYNGECPVCGLEVARYRRMMPGADATCWSDVAVDQDALAAHGLTVDDVVRRIHVLTRDGRMLVGVPALAAIWRETPSRPYQALARFVSLPLVRGIAAGAYEVLAAILYAWNTARGSNPARRKAGAGSEAAR
jgi:predicted DCC family thiol-disulfide oxidoreductase YuxK